MMVSRPEPGVPVIFHIALPADWARLDAPVVEESLDSGGEAYPHIYGALPIPAVMTATTWSRLGPDYTLDS